MGRPNKYPDQFRKDALELVRTSQRPIAEVAFDPFASPWRPAAAPATPEAEPEEADLPSALARFERRRLEAALQAARHNQREAARRLGLGYDQLRHRLRKHGSQ